jgi:predicted TIM-barrel fold metal-dependent hydrolase
MIVDLHAHYFPKDYNAILLRIGGRSLPEAARPITARPMREDDPGGLATRLKQMDEAGVQLQVLSPAASPPYAEKEVDAVEAARLINDRYAELAKTYPDRLAAFVSLPLPHIDAALREMERGLDRLGMLGVSMTCSCFDRSTAEAEFEPLYQEMNRRGAVLNYHPIQNGICSPMINDYRFTVSVGASLEDSAIVLHLIARRVPERYPRIKYVVPHLGGIIPMLLQRLDNQAPRQYPDLPEPPSVTARRFYYDTVGHGSQAALTTPSCSPSRRTGRRSTTSASAACPPRTSTRSSTTTPRSSWACRTETLLPHHRREVGPWTWGFEASMRS